jgi:hypothetical protein
VTTSRVPPTRIAVDASTIDSAPVGKLPQRR